MLSITKQVQERLKRKKLTGYKLSKLIDYKDSSLYKMIGGKIAFPDHVIEKIAPILGVSVEEIKIWILADKYPKEVFEQAIRLKKEKQDDKLLLTTKLDEILHSKQLSRTALSKLIKYSQGGLNEMIIGKEPMSKQVISKISVALDIPENEIKCWIATDKYSIESLEKALKILQNKG